MAALKPVIYQLLPRLFANYCEAPVADGTLEQNGSGKLNDINEDILASIKALGATHVWYTGVIEHGHDADYTAYGIPRHNRHIIKGKAGSPYAITDYYDIDPDLAVNVPERMKEFEALVKRSHEAGLKVIIDFVPNHVGREYNSDAKPAGIEDFGSRDNREMFFSASNNFYYMPHQQFAPHIDLGSGSDAYVEFPAKATGNDCFTAFPGANDWYETVKLNYGVDYSNHTEHFYPVPDTWFKMLHILRFWASKGVDGFRCDMAFMVPLQFWHWAVPQVKSHYPHVVFIAEIYDVNLYRTLRAIETQNHSAAMLTNCWQTVDGIQPQMLNFIENHDEQRFASTFYAGDPWRVVPSLVVSTMMSTGPMMIYFGQELGEPASDAEGFSGHDGRTTIFDYWSLSCIRRWLNLGKCHGPLTDSELRLRSIYSRILNMANSEPAIAEGAFFDLMYVNYENPGFNPHRHYAFLRSCDDDLLLIAVNFSDSDADMSINIPQHAFDFLDIPEGIDQNARELLSGAFEAKQLSTTMPFVTRVPAHGAVIWKISRERLSAPVSGSAATKKAAKPKSIKNKKNQSNK